MQSFSLVSLLSQDFVCFNDLKKKSFRVKFLRSIQDCSFFMRICSRSQQPEQIVSLDKISTPFLWIFACVCIAYCTYIHDSLIFIKSRPRNAQFFLCSHGTLTVLETSWKPSGFIIWMFLRKMKIFNIFC